MQGHRPYQLYFRHPETHTGDTNAKRQAIEEFLAARGYVIAPHTIDSEDFMFNVAYASVCNRCQPPLEAFDDRVGRSGPRPLFLFRTGFHETDEEMVARS